MAADLLLFDGDVKDFGFNEGIKVKLTPFKAVRPSRDLVIVAGMEDNRKIVENKHVDILLDPDRSWRKDKMHHRNSGLDDVTCKFAKKNNIAIGFSFKSFLEEKDISVKLGRLMQNIRFCRKFKVRMVFCSLAANKSGMRNISDLSSFLKVAGMSPKEAQEAFNPASILKEKRAAVGKGVRLVEG